MLKNRVEEARRVLQRLRPAGSDCEAELRDIQESCAQARGGVRELLARPALRRVLLLAMSMQAINQLVGINSIMYYSASILEMAGITVGLFSCSLAFLI